MLKDHLGNVRAVLTDEAQTDDYPAATMEDDNASLENLYYTNIDETRDDRPGEMPADYSTTPNDKVARVHGTDQKIGPGILLKVQAGDEIEVWCQSWWNNNQTSYPTQPDVALEELVATFLSDLLTGASGGKFPGGAVGRDIIFPGIVEMLGRAIPDYDPINKPKAFLNFMFLNEQFQYLELDQSQRDQVSYSNDYKLHEFSRSNWNSIYTGQSGYLYIYTSNETANLNVFFDNLKVKHHRGPLLEETHYYPFGLTMAGISSKAAGKLENKNEKFQGQPLDDDLGLNWYGFKWRNHDPQIGRFIQIDPLSEEYVHNSTYAFSENKVVAHIELEGLEAVPYTHPMQPIMDGFGQGFQAMANWFDKTFSFGTKDKVTTNSTANPNQASDASGRKICKKVFEPAATVHYNNQTYTSEATTETWYLGAGVYESKTYSHPALDPLEYSMQPQFFAQEEGRIRYVNAEVGQPAALHFDYMLKDHLGNVRMVLTEEIKQIVYPAATLEEIGSPEPAVDYERTAYYDINTDNVVGNEQANGIPAYNNNNGFDYNHPVLSSTQRMNTQSQKLYKLNSTSAKTGLGITLKVMAGDKLDIFGMSYHDGSTGSTSGLDVPQLLAGFIGAPGSAAAGKLTGIQAEAINPLGSALYSFLQNRPPPVSSPKAYINYIFFDEQFKFVSGGCSMVKSSGGWKQHYEELQNIAVPKNGYVYVFCSNETDKNVFFDNLQLIHTQGPMLEETHYYPFGLTMAGISSKAAGKLENKFKFNEGTELTNDFDLSLYETKYRSLDPQIGRFWQIDPLAGLSFDLSPYNYGSNNPILRNDPLGLKDTIINNKKYNVLENVTVTAKRRVTPVIQVYIWSKTPKSNNGGNKDVGHTAIRVGNLVYGFYPTDTDGDNQLDLMGSPGEMHVDTIGKGGSFDRHYMTQEILAFQLRLTPAQIKKLQNILKEIKANPGNYWLTGRQCTSVAAGAILRSGVVIGAQNPLEGMRLNGVGGMSPNEFKNVLNTPINKDLVERVLKFVVGQ